ncbi:MAG: S1 family peptidase [Actinomycetota bacterium]|nr:S1 family peptidase [Actinomycetota bacterium]
MRRRTLIRSAAVLMLALSLQSAPARAQAPGPLDGCTQLRGRGDTPLGVTPCPGVRPGAWLEISFPDRRFIYSCTLNFLFEGSDGRRYAATAGHCPLEDGQEGRFTWRSGKAPIANILKGGSARRVGEFVYAVVDDVSDFALIRLDPGVRSNPRMCHFGGPTGLNSDLTSAPTLLHHYGNGIAIGWVVPARSAVTPGLGDRRSVTAYGAAYEIDSGSPVIGDDGRAIGVLVAVRVGGTPGEQGIVITRLAPQLAEAEDLLRIDLRLLTAPLS